MPLWALGTAFAQQFLKMLWAADQVTCSESDHIAIGARTLELGGGTDEPSSELAGLTSPQLPLGSGYMQVESPEMQRVSLFLRCRNHVNHGVLKISSFGSLTR